MGGGLYTSRRIVFFPIQILYLCITYTKCRVAQILTELASQSMPVIEQRKKPRSALRGFLVNLMWRLLVVQRGRGCETSFLRVLGQLVAATKVQALQNLADVVFDRGFADVERAGDFSVACTLGYQF